MLCMMVRCRRGQYGSPRTRLATAALRCRVIGREMAWRGVCRGAYLPRCGEPRRIAFLAHATKSNRQIGIVLAAKLGTLTIRDALAFGLEPDSFVRPGTAAMRSLRRAQFFPPARRLRPPPWSFFLETDLSRRKPKASRQNARAEGFDESRGRPGKPQIAALGPWPI
jgi:hypothetical protein